MCQYVYMICIYCFNKNTKVTNSRPHKKASGGVWRRRQCPSCAAIFSTLETPTSPKLTIAGVSTNSNTSAGSRETSFSLSQLTVSIGQCFAHNQGLGKRSALDLAQTVEQALIRSAAVPSVDDITIATHITLKRFDELAAAQYAARHDILAQPRRRRR